MARHAAGADEETKPIWALFMFELWHREFMDPSQAPLTLEVAR